MEYIYLNCNPSKRNTLKKIVQGKYDDSSYIIVDRFQDSTQIISLGKKTPDMLTLEATARSLDIPVLEISEKEYLKRSRSRTRSKDYNLEH